MSKLRVPLVLLLVVMLTYDGYCLAERGSATSRKVVQTGIASWYGREEQGKPTADGETFDRHEMTAASRKLPFNTLVRVTNEDNGRSVQVRINDRGPWVKDRVLDLSEAAADTLDMKSSGTAPVKIQIVEPPPVSIVPSP